MKDKNMFSMYSSFKLFIRDYNLSEEDEPDRSAMLRVNIGVLHAISSSFLRNEADFIANNAKRLAKTGRIFPKQIFTEEQISDSLTTEIGLHVVCKKCGSFNSVENDEVISCNNCKRTIMPKFKNEVTI